MAFTSDQPRVTSLDETPLTNYRSLSVAALAALALGLLSPVALAHPLLWILPPVAVVVAIFALRSIAAVDSNLTGRGLALTGMFVAIVFGVCAPARNASRQMHLYRQAQAFADDWLELVRSGELQAAHQLTLPQIERQKPDVNLQRFYVSTEAKTRFENFARQRPLKTMAELGDKATYAYRGGEGIAPPQHITEEVALGYDVRYEEDGAEKSFPIRIVLARQAGADGNFFWTVQGVGDPNRVE